MTHCLIALATVALTVWLITLTARWLADAVTWLFWRNGW